MEWIKPLCCALAGVFCADSPANADGIVLRQADGTTALVTDLGNGIGLMSDPHHVLTPTPLPPQPDGSARGRPGADQPGIALPFGMPAPPNGLTPPPTLPFHPNRPLLPSASMTQPRTGPAGGRFGK